MRLSVLQRASTCKPRTLLCMSERLMTESELADYLAVHIATVRRLRRSGKGPPVVWVGRHPRYRRSEVDAWLDRAPEERGEGG
jgi:excisionase family DNA binding protein